MHPRLASGSGLRQQNRSSGLTTSRSTSFPSLPTSNLEPVVELLDLSHREGRYTRRTRISNSMPHSLNGETADPRIRLPWLLHRAVTIFIDYLCRDA